MGAEQLIADLMRSWAPPPRLALSQWADEKFYLSPESAAEPGKWKTLPYQRGIMDAFTDPRVEQVWVQKSARVGWTKIMNCVVGYYVEHDPCPMMVVQPTETDAEEYSKEEIAPMLRDCPSLAALIEARARDSSNTILHKTFINGAVLQMVGANSPTGFRRVSRKVVLFDEVSGYPPSAGTEGDQIKLGIRRSEYYWDRKIGGGSTPTNAATDRINKLFLAGDQRYFYVPCPHCGHSAPLVFRRESEEGHFMHWPKGSPERAHFVCRDCAAAIEERYKRPIIEAGDWQARADFAGIASFHVWAAYSYSPNATWGQLAKEFVDANGEGPLALKTFVNTVLGEVWVDRGEAPDWERLYRRRELYVIGRAPAGVLFLTCGVDVQKDRLVFEIVGWGRAKESWSIDAGVIPGDTADLSERGPWAQLAAILDREYPHESGVNMRVGLMAVDSGYNTSTVYSWCRRYPMNRVIAIRGDDHSAVLIGTPSPVDVNLGGRKQSRAYKVWPVSSKLAKTELYGWLRLEQATEEDGSGFPPGYCHFPEYGEEFFRQLTAEQLVPKQKKAGYIVHEWEVLPGRENHWLDARNYARCAASVVGLDRFTESDWRKLERAAGMSAPTPAQAAQPNAAPSALESAPAAAPAAGRSPWLGRRNGGWLDRRR